MESLPLTALEYLNVRLGEHESSFASMDSWSLGMVKLALRFAEDYADYWAKYKEKQNAQ